MNFLVYKRFKIIRLKKESKKIKKGLGV